MEEQMKIKIGRGKDSYKRHRRTYKEIEESIGKTMIKVELPSDLVQKLENLCEITGITKSQLITNVLKKVV